MARAPSRRFGFVKLPGKSKRWRNENNPDFPIGATISDRAMSGLSRSLRFAGQTVSKERYAKGVKSGAFTYHPKTIRRLEALQFRRAMIDRLAPQMTTSERRPSTNGSALPMLETRTRPPRKGRCTAASKRYSPNMKRSERPTR